MPPPERRLPSVSSVPAVRGNAAAQELDARLTAGETPLGRLGVVAFWTPARRDLVMQLPTVSGEAVLQAFGKGAGPLTTIPEERREASLHALLHNLVEARWRIDCQRLWLAVAPSELFPESLLTQRPADLSAWYRETYEKQAKRDEDLAKKEADAARHPGREWRVGRAQEPGGFAAPPRDPAAHAKRSMRFKVPGEVRPGEQWAHPGDTGAMWPGVSASHRANPVPPKLTGGEDLPARDYCWVPLARRVDLDRVVNTLLEFPSISRT